MAEGTALDRPTSATTRPLPTTRTFRIGTFNIDGGQGADDRVDLHRTASQCKYCDLLGLQEVHGRLHGNGAMTIAGDLGMQYLFAPTERQWWHDAFGNALLTSLPVKHWQRFQLSSNQSQSNRNIVLARLAFGDRTIKVLITHLDRHADHECELRSVCELFLSLGQPAILLGDLNDNSENPLLAELCKAPGVVDVVGKMKPAARPKHGDWIFLHGLKCHDSGFVDKGVSDHPFYWADVSLTP